MSISINNPLLKPQHPCMKGSAGIFPEHPVIEDPRVVGRLVNNLAYLFNVSSGDYLTFILGHGECTRNEDALKYWVLDQLEQESVGADDVLGVLVDRLREQLTQEVYS